MPFLSPDGEWLGFVSERKLKKVPLDGGQPVVICDAPDPRGASWGEDGTILLAPNNAGGLFRVSASGGALEPVSQPDLSRKEDGHRWPQVIPGGKAALFSVQPQSGREPQRTIEALNLVTGQRKTLVRGGATRSTREASFRPGWTDPRGPFDPERPELTGEPQPVLDDVRMAPKTNGIVYFDVSRPAPRFTSPASRAPRPRSRLHDRQDGSPVSALSAPFSPGGLSRRAADRGHREGLEDTLWSSTSSPGH
jgi:serine/threonine-protein kinase